MLTYLASTEGLFEISYELSNVLLDLAFGSSMIYLVQSPLKIIFKVLCEGVAALSVCSIHVLCASNTCEVEQHLIVHSTQRTDSTKDTRRPGYRG